MGVGARLGDIRAPPEGLESCMLIKPPNKRLLFCDVVQWLSHLGVAGNGNWHNQGMWGGLPVQQCRFVIIPHLNPILAHLPAQELYL